ncbi:MAG: hypothetical protein C0469_13035, partial [Cyanobacteria bacterium DS2.3.42]|nr:hypothetical protein [Cyanobacteria bacterium DS2.3.42]
MASVAISVSLAAQGAPQKATKSQPEAKANSAGAAKQQPPSKGAHTKANAKVDTHIVLRAMKKELDRSFSKLKNAGNAPLYFLAYRIYDTETVDIKATFGGLLSANRP